MIVMYNILWVYSFKLTPVYKQHDNLEGECRNETLLCIMMIE